nr:hypothetical protein [Ktedonobacterales bacterium]
MREFTELVAPCRYGKLIITAGSVGVRPIVGFRRKSRHWEVPREKITGVSSYGGSFGRDLVIHTCDGRHLRAEWVAPRQALPVIQLLGHTAMALPDELRLAGRARPHTRVRWGRLVISRDTVSLKPLFFIRHKHHWTVPRTAVTGVVTKRRPGMRMMYDVTIYTTEGEALRARRLAPDNAIHVSRNLGHVFGPLPMPPSARADHAALELALEDMQESTWETPEERWESSADMEWRREPQAPRRTSPRGWGARLSQRERALSIRFGTLAGLFLLGVYVTAALVGGKTLAQDAAFARSLALGTAPHAPRTWGVPVGSVATPVPPRIVATPIQ